VEFKIRVTQPHTLGSTPKGPSKPDNHEGLGCKQSKRTRLT